ncbi:MAG TPA: hypothetical protein VEA99_19485 [Gemmatimonadaceae bacterium]|nr:hypothetical protein [Gemmatimonadaceae bacterium]
MSGRIGFAIVAALSVGSAAIAPLSAQARELFKWNGRVERETYITMRGGSARAMEGRYESRGSLRLENALPRGEGRVLVRLERGSADVDVVQQPHRRNDYTAVIRVRDYSRDDRVRDDRIRLAAFWRPEYANDRNDRGPGGGWGVIDDRNDRNDGRWERRDDARDLGARTAFRWSGVVDSEVEIHLQGRRATYRTLRGDVIREVRLDAEHGLPRELGVVSIGRQYGRGSVSVISQPDARNGFTAVIRVSDPQGGASRYEFDILWRDGDRRGW